METTDIEKMLAATAAAGEDTGEGDVSKKKGAKSGPFDVPDTIGTQKKPEPVKAPEPVKEIPRVQEPVKQPQRNIEPVKASKPEPVKVTESFRTPESQRNQEPVREPIRNQEPVRKPASIAGSMNGGSITEASIDRILLMNMRYNKLNEQQKGFVSGYFQVENEANTISKVIFKSLTASQRDLEALKKIVEAKSYDPAARAFFLMSLSNTEIEDIFEQLDLIVGDEQLAAVSSKQVNQTTKLEICIAIEKVVSSMSKDLFSYIEKLQEFTDSSN